VLSGAVDLGAYEQQPSNQPPTLDPLANLTILEDASAQTISLTGISAGTGESQTLSITALSWNPALIANPSMSYSSPKANGSLSFTPAANASGSATITVTVRDSGGTSGGGVDTLVRSFIVTVTPVNDAPSFTPGANQSVQAGAGAVTVSSWASGFTPGPADEAGQTLVGYTIISNSACGSV
jgi:Big-like domain-containing protein